jgi:lipopolysaccharide transport system ATP-binding protein
VDFSGVNGFLDTPVKRYSSGMFVRLAFAVAAHLESDILIVDEVLAVGDYEFQQKCMGKMQDVANNKGRTVLFVSHNSAAVQRLCTRAMLLSNGSVKLTGSPAEVLEVYQVNHADKTDGLRDILDDDKSAYFLRWVLISQAGAGAFTARSGERVAIRASLNVRRRLSGAVLHCMVRDLNGNSLVYVRSNDDSQVPLTLEVGTHEVEFGFSLPVRHGEYGVERAVSEPDSLIDHWESSTRLKVVDKEFRDHHALEGLLSVETTFRIV